MNKLTYYIVDVFAEEKYAGNQLAVFRGADAVSDIEMQKIAKEMNFSETTFILSESEREGGYDVRIFTPGEEVPFAGHPTLGTAHIIRNEILIDKTSISGITLNLKAGQIPVNFEPGENSIYWMKQLKPEFGKQLSTDKLAQVLGLDPEDMDSRFPIEEVSTGLPHIIVPLRSLESLKRARVNRDRYFELIKDAWARPIMIFCPEPHLKENDISVRMFADCFGIPEDPATGSGNGCLAGYLVKHRYFGGDSVDIRSEQGYEIGRPSLLYLRAEERGGQIHVSVGGKAITIARGDFV